MQNVSRLITYNRQNKQHPNKYNTYTMDFYQISEQKMRLLGYAKNTQKIYLHFINQYLHQLDKPANRVSADEFQKYIENYQYKSQSHQNQVVNALKFFYQSVLGKKYNKVIFYRPRKHKKLPKAIAKKVILDGIDRCDNLKHKAIMMLGNSVGLRVSEVCNLKLTDIDSDRMEITIKCSKGFKDRNLPLSENVLLVLREYYKQYRPTIYLFKGQFSEQYSPMSCNKIVKRYIGSNVHFHQLRHSFATTLIESGVDLPTLANMLGHSRIETTMIYTHISKAHLSNVHLPI